MFKYFLASITRNALSLAGTALALASLVLIISLLVIQALGYEGGPYLGIVTFLVLPALAIVGLIMIPIGGALSDRFGGKPVILTATVLMGITVYPLFVIIDHGIMLEALLAQLWFAVLFGKYLQPFDLVE